MSDVAVNADRVFDLTGAICDESASESDRAEMDTYLLADRQSCNRYLNYCWLHVALSMELQVQRAIQHVHQQIDIKLAAPAIPATSEFGIANAEPPKFPAPIFLSTALHGTVGFFSQELPFSLLIATVLTGLGLWFASMIYVSSPDKIAKDSSPVQSSFDPTIEIVGKITGMVDCKWSDDKNFLPPGGDDVSLGRKYKLDSGLMEITYNTGAKVILQGPVTYEVESANGGYMSVGKLTGKVEVEKAKGFVVRTPTAIVTDLGTGFGVEVAINGDTAVHVFQGKVALNALSGGKPMGDVVLLAESESAQIKRQPGKNVLMVSRGKVDTTRFVQVEKFAGLLKQRNQTPLQHWQAYSRQLRKDPTLVAYYTCESTSDGIATLPNLSSLGHALDGRIEGAAWTAGRVPGKCSLYFLGKGSGNKVILPENDCFEFSDAFSVAVWFKFEMTCAAGGMLVAKEDISWRIMYNILPGSYAVKFDTNGTKHPTSDFQVTIGNTYPMDNQWHLVVGVYEPDGEVARKRLYLDGRLESENTAAMPRLKNRSPVLLGSTGTWPDGEHYGWIDEVAIFSRALSAQEIGKMLHSCDPRNR